MLYNDLRRASKKAEEQRLKQQGVIRRDIAGRRSYALRRR